MQTKSNLQEIFLTRARKQAVKAEDQRIDEDDPMKKYYQTK